MDFFEAVERRRSIRKYTDEPVPAEVIQRALDAAILAPSSSNMQTTEYYWVRSPEKRSRLVRACLDQGAASTAPELVAFVADYSLWRRNNKELKRLHSEGPGAKHMYPYYQKLMPFVYGWQILNPLKMVFMYAVGLFRPMMRTPWSHIHLQEIAIKSAALSAENFMLAIAAQGYDTCPMEGFDELRAKSILGLWWPWRWRSRIVMVVSVGMRAERGVWGERIRLPRDWFVKEI